MKIIGVSLVVFLLVGCASNLTAPKAPEYGDFKYKKRMVVNQTVPNEVRVRN